MIARTSADPPVDDGGRVVGQRASSFADFYERELALQLRRATLLIGNPHTARDLVHDVFADLYERWHRVEQPGSYLNVSVVNRCRDHARKQRRRSQQQLVITSADEPEHDELWDVLQRLPFNHRAALVLRFYHQMTDREIADCLGCRIGSVGPWLHRGLAQLRKELT